MLRQHLNSTQYACVDFDSIEEKKGTEEKSKDIRNEGWKEGSKERGRREVRKEEREEAGSKGKKGRGREGRKLCKQD